MPKPLPKESKEDYLTRCMGDEEAKGKYPDDHQRYAVCNSLWDGEAFSRYRSFAIVKVSFDYDMTLTRAMDIARRWISKGAEVYIISARSDKAGMLSRAAALGIPSSRVFATGSNAAKVKKIKDLGISKHYDNNPAVIKDLGSIGVQFADDSWNDYPKAATENAKIAIRWAEENGWGDCGTAVGKARAHALADGRPLSRDVIARMAAFERHRQSSQRVLGDGCGRLMWLAWGGDEGIDWAKRKLKEIDSGKA